MDQLRICVFKPNGYNHGSEVKLAETLGKFHQFSLEGDKATVEDMDGQVHIVDAETIRFLKSEELMERVREKLK